MFGGFFDLDQGSAGYGSYKDRLTQSASTTKLTDRSTRSRVRHYGGQYQTSRLFAALEFLVATPVCDELQILAQNNGVVQACESLGER